MVVHDFDCANSTYQSLLSWAWLGPRDVCRVDQIVQEPIARRSTQPSIIAVEHRWSEHTT